MGLAQTGYNLVHTSPYYAVFVPLQEYGDTYEAKTDMVINTSSGGDFKSLVKDNTNQEYIRNMEFIISDPSAITNAKLLLYYIWNYTGKLVIQDDDDGGFTYNVVIDATIEERKDYAVLRLSLAPHLLGE